MAKGRCAQEIGLWGSVLAGPRRRRGGGRRALGVVWQGEERAQREAKAAVRARARRVEKLSRQEVAL